MKTLSKFLFMTERDLKPSYSEISRPPFRVRFAGKINGTWFFLKGLSFGVRYLIMTIVLVILGWALYILL